MTRVYKNTKDEIARFRSGLKIGFTCDPTVLTREIHVGPFGDYVKYPRTIPDVEVIVTTDNKRRFYANGDACMSVVAERETPDYFVWYFCKGAEMYRMHAVRQRKSLQKRNADVRRVETHQQSAAVFYTTGAMAHPTFTKSTGFIVSAMLFMSFKNSTSCSGGCGSSKNLSSCSGDCIAATPALNNSIIFFAPTRGFGIPLGSTPLNWT